MGKRLSWVDHHPYLAALYEIDDDIPFGRCVASIRYDHDSHTFTAFINNGPLDKKAPYADSQTDIPTKIEAMEAAMAMLVANRFDRAN